MSNIIQFVLLVVALGGLRYVYYEVEDSYLELKEWIKYKHVKTFGVYDFEMLMRCLLLIACNVIIFAVSIISIIHWDSFSILKIYISVIGIMYNIYEALDRKFKILNKIFEEWILRVIAVLIILVMYTLIYYFKDYCVEPISVTVIFIIQVIVWIIVIALFRVTKR